MIASNIRMLCSYAAIAMAMALTLAVFFVAMYAKPEQEKEALKMIKIYFIPAFILVVTIGIIAYFA